MSHLPVGAVDSLGPKAALLAERCGRVLDPWQRLTLDGAMSVTESGKWAALDVDLIASRQNGKNGGLEARELYGAVILGEWFIHTAHQFKTTKESYAKLLELVEADDEVRSRLIYRVASPASGYEMRFAGGGRVQFIARSRTSGRGLTGDVLVMDEAQELDDDMLGAILPTISAGPKGNPQTWYQGSAPGPDAVVWQRRRSSGRAGVGDRRAYFEFSADPDCDPDDRAAWAQANPGLGHRLMVEVIEAERTAMSEEMFARERLSVSPELVDGGHVIGVEAWAARRDEQGMISGAPTFAVDVAEDRAWTSIAVAGARSDGAPQVEVVDRRAGTAWVVPRLRELVDAWDAPVVADPSGPAGSLFKEAAAVGVDIEPVSTREVTQACGLFYDEVCGESPQLWHRGDPALDAALRAAERRFVGDGAWLWSRKNSNADISALVAVTLARWASQGAEEVDVSAHVW